MFQICAFIGFLISTHTQASVVKFTAYPSELKANLSSSASMRCSLADNDASGGQIGKTSASSTADDILHISGIVITRNNAKDVATITPFDAPIAAADLGNLQVKGDLSATSSEGFLELTWKDPSAMALGEYVCEVNTVDIHHHPVLLTSTLEMTDVTPTISDVIAEFKDLHKKQEMEIDNLRLHQSEELKKLTKETNKLETEIQDLKQQQTTTKQCASRRFGFMAAISHWKTIATGQEVVFDKVIYSVGGGYDNTTGHFTCSEPGIYSFSIHSLSTYHAWTGLNLKLNSTIITSAYSYGAQSVETGATSALIHLDRNDFVHVTTDRPSEFTHNPNSFQSNVFVGHMVQSDCVV